MGELLQFSFGHEMVTQEPLDESEHFDEKTRELMQGFRADLDSGVNGVESGEQQEALLYSFEPEESHYVYAPSTSRRRFSLPMNAFLDVVAEFQEGLGRMKGKRTGAGTVLHDKIFDITDVYDCGKRDGIELEERKTFDKNLNHIRTAVLVRGKSHQVGTPAPRPNLRVV